MSLVRLICLSSIGGLKSKLALNRSSPLAGRDPLSETVLNYDKSMVMESRIVMIEGDG